MKSSITYTTLHPKVPVKVSKPKFLSLLCMIICQMPGAFNGLSAK